jgi:hypothetical protein
MQNLDLYEDVLNEVGGKQNGGEQNEALFCFPPFCFPPKRSNSMCFSNLHLLNDF